MPESSMGGDQVFPKGLIGWAGHRSGGVRRMFDVGSGRPAGAVVETALIRRLREWATNLSAGRDVPKVVLLVGGPGNGKTEAVEAALQALDAGLRLNGVLEAALRAQLVPAAGVPVPRLVPFEANTSDGKRLHISVVQDASLADVARPGKSPAELLLEELELFCLRGGGTYIACVNRGVLDDALILATDHARAAPRALLEAITRSLAVAPDAPSCWPLLGFEQATVWPMDVESLFVGEGDSGSPASTVLDLATDPARWPDYGSCPAGVRCPFCSGRKSLAAGSPARDALLSILRWHEVASGKRWTFRDLFSLVPQLLASVPADDSAQDPCQWAARMIELDRAPGGAGRSDRQRSTAIFFVAAAHYAHVLFSDWSRGAARRIQLDAKELGLDGDRTIQGLCAFLRGAKRTSIPSTLRPLLSSVCGLLDPALARPELEVAVSRSRAIRLGDLDARFSRSVEAGLEYLVHMRSLSPLERELFGRLADCEKKAHDAGLRSARGRVSAERLQFALRDFACRWARRSFGAEQCAVRDRDVLRAFQAVVEAPESSEEQVFAAAKKVEGLLNNGGAFEIPLNTTFGEPLPPAQRRATLVAPRQRVRPQVPKVEGRPRSPLVFLTIGGSHSHAPAVPLTYDLFKAVVDLGDGLYPASLPSTVVALLDATRARLAGTLVRDEELLEYARIRVGDNSHEIALGPRGFVVVEGVET